MRPEIASMVVARLAATAAAVIALTYSQGVSGQVVTPTVSSTAPRDVEISAGFSGDPVRFFDDFSWRTFVALNWPAVEDQRGEPDTTKAFGDPAPNVVWGTWKADHEIFQPNGMPPSPWESFEAQSPDQFTEFANAGKVKVLGGFGPRGSELQIEHFNQAGLAGNEVGTLVGSNRRYIRYEVRINKPEFNFIRNGEFYLAAKLPTTGQLVFPEGSGEIKAAWRTFTATELANLDLMGRYYTVEAILVDPNGASTKTRVGLIGLHIVRRTPTRPEWIWSSFEHVDNLTGASPTLRPAQPGDVGVNALRNVVNKEPGNNPLPDPDPVPVRRLKPIRSETVEINVAYQGHEAIKDTVWKNYQLVLTQWPRTPAATEQQFVQGFSVAYPQGAGNPSPTDLANSSIANVTMETTAAFQITSSCMRCHFNAGVNKHTEFVWTVPLRAFQSNASLAAQAKKDIEESAKPLMDALEATTNP